MTFKICGRRGGKSYEIARRAESNPKAAVIVPTLAMVRMTEENFPKLKGRVFSLDQVRQGRLQGTDTNTIHIDNLDMMLATLLNLGGNGWYPFPKIDLVTATGSLDLRPNPFLSPSAKAGNAPD
jgi:hypothetical protein